MLDDIRMVDPSRSVGDATGDSGKPSIQLEEMPYLSITMASNRFETLYDGFIGFAPWFMQEPKYMVFNFLYNLKYHLDNAIDHTIVSFYITS